MSCDNSGVSTLQAPVFAAIVMPSTLGAPTHSVERYNNPALKCWSSFTNNSCTCGFRRRPHFLVLGTVPRCKTTKVSYMISDPYSFIY